MAKNSIESWLELESDPGLFSLLVEDFGVKGIEVEEIYELNKSFENQFVYGFIFLFKWVEDKRSRRKIENSFENSYLMDVEKVNSMFFAKQIVPNSCATHALLSVILNCPDIVIGNCLEKLKENTYLYSPENKGYAIASMEELAQAHNKHAKRDWHHHHHHHSFRSKFPSAYISSPQKTQDPHLKDNNLMFQDKSPSLPHATSPNSASSPPTPTKLSPKQPITTINSPLSHLNSTPIASFVSSCGNTNNTTSMSASEDDSFHYVSFVPISGTLYELDGLKPYPINHGKWQENESWTDKFRSILSERINATSNQSLDCSREIRYNLLAVVTDKRAQIKKKLHARRSELSSALESLPKVLKMLSMPVYNQLFNNPAKETTVQNACDLIIKEKVTHPTQRFALRRSCTYNDESSLNRAEGGEMHELAVVDSNLSGGDYLKGMQAKEDFVLDAISERVKRKIFQYMLCKGVTLREADPEVERQIINFDLDNYMAFLKELNNETTHHEDCLDKENEKWDRYKVDDARRTHDYTAFINTFLNMLAEKKLIADLIENNLTTSNLRYANKVRKKVRRTTRVTTRKTHKIIR